MGLLDAPALTRAQATAALNLKTRRVILGAGGPNSTNSSVTNVLFRVPFRAPVNTKRWRFRWRNTTGLGVASPNVVTITSVWIGTHALDASGARTGNFTAAPAQALGTATTAADGSEYISPWVTDSTLQFVANRQHLISYGLDAPAGTVFNRLTHQAHYLTNATGQAGNQTITPAGLSSVFGDLRIECEYEGPAESVLFVGDSLTDGWASALGLIGSYPAAFAARTGQAATIAAMSGITAQTVAGYTSSDWYWTRAGLGAGGFVPDAAVLFVGTNDVDASRTDVQVEADIGTIIGTLRGFGISRIYAATITPRNYAGADAKETARNAVNTWLRARPFGLLDVFEYDRAVLASGSTTLLDTAYDNGDALHLNTAGLARVARVIPGRI